MDREDDDGHGKRAIIVGVYKHRQGYIEFYWIQSLFALLFDLKADKAILTRIMGKWIMITQSS